MRIIGGQWKRSKLKVLDAAGLRPTPDRVRETLFNWLGQDLSGLRCLDAFAGSGALGLEAASRGAAQVLLVALVCLWPVFQVMGRDYESAVMSGGFIGFMLGTTANAMAVMRTLVERFGPAPKAFFVAPMVGAFFIDFTNALLITAFLNIF